MSRQPIETLSHEFMIRDHLALLEVPGETPVALALGGAEDLLDAVNHGLRELMNEPAVSHQATLLHHALMTAEALVIAAKAGIDAWEARHVEA